MPEHAALFGLPMSDYLALPAIGSGVIKKTLSECPAAGWFASYLNPNREPDPSKASDAGTIAHCIVLEGHSDMCAVIDPADYPADKTGKIPDGWTNKAIREARDYARLNGKIPVLAPHWGEIKSMADSALRFIDSLKTSAPEVWRIFQPNGGASEVTMRWDDGETPCRIRTDRLQAEGKLVADLKFINGSAHPDGFARSGLIGMGYATAAGFYRRGLKAVYRVEADYQFIVTEQRAPYLTSLVGLDPTWLAYADERAKRGLAIWQQCVERNHWPAYPARTAYPELPPWELAKLEAEAVEEFVGSPVDYAVLAGAK